MIDRTKTLLAVRRFAIAACFAALTACGAATSLTPASSSASTTGGTSTTQQDPVPVTPIDLTAAAGNAQVNLTWPAVEYATSYDIKRATVSGGPYSQLANSDSPSYTDSAVNNGTEYFYVVSALDAAGQSANSAQASATPDPTISIANAPLNLAASGGNAQVTLTWSASSGAVSYNVKRATTTGGPYTTIATSTAAAYIDTTVTNGTVYFYVVSAVNAAGESANSAQVSATPDPLITVPAAPTNLTTTAGNASVALSWRASSGATGYHVKRASTSGGPYTQIAAPSGSPYTDTSVSNGTTYYYVVSALNSAGESANSSEVAATPDPTVTIPGAPANLTATAGNAQVSLTWTASSGALSYNVKRATISGGPYSQLANSSSPSYTDAAVSNGTTYYYVVSALDSAGESANSAQAAATPDPTITVPAAPLNLTATGGNAQVSLAWSSSTGAVSYTLSRATTSGGPYTQIAAPSSTSYTDTSVTNGTAYYYVVAAVNSAGSSANSAQAAATPDPIITVPAAPLNLTATAGNASVALSWSASTGATAYQVKRATTSGGPYTQVAAPTATSYTDSSLTNGTTYYYVVLAVNSAGASANSSQAAATPAAPIAVPGAPTNLVASAGNASVAISWTASGGANSYTLSRATTTGGPYTQIAAPTSTSYTDTSVTNGTTYYYVVAAVNSAGASANSSQASATPAAPITVPAAPTNLAAAAGNASVALSWTASSGATSYHVKRATTSGGPYTQIAAPTGTSYTDSSLTNGTTYYYVVSALDSAGESANSSQVSAVPVAPAPAPTSFGTWVNVTPSQIDLTDNLEYGNYGTETVQADTANPGVLYSSFNEQGIWKSTDYGVTWTEVAATGTNGATVNNAEGGITLSPSSTPGGVPTIYSSSIRGPAIGFWKSTDGGVNWTNYNIAPLASNRQDVYPVVIDPYDPKHLLVCGHEQDFIGQSTDGGETWTNVNLDSGMNEGGGTGAIIFVNTGVASTTRTTWLWMGQTSGGVYGTWRTTNGGTTWTKVDNMEHQHGLEQSYTDSNHVIYLAGSYSAEGDGVIRSTDYGQTWTHVGNDTHEEAVWGTPNNVYSMYGYPVGIGGVNDPVFEVGAQPGTGKWTQPGTPASYAQGAAQAAVVYDGTHYIIVMASWNSGLWRYVEP